MVIKCPKVSLKTVDKYTLSMFSNSNVSTAFGLLG